MRNGPLHRAVALLGLVVLAPTAWMTATGQISAEDAGLRAVVTLLGVVLVNRVVNWGVRRSSTALVRAAAARRTIGTSARETARDGR